MKIERVRYKKGRPYIEYHSKNRKWPVRCFGEIHKCKHCGCYFFAPFSNINKGYGLYCSRSCQIKDNLGENANNWKGGEIIKSGYVYIYRPQHPYSDSVGYVAEHRLILEKKLKRYLLPTEIAHHKNGITNDNRAENIELFEWGKHSSYHNKGRIHIKGLIRNSKYRKKYGKTLKEMAKDLNITPQGVFYQIKKEVYHAYYKTCRSEHQKNQGR